MRQRTTLILCLCFLAIIHMATISHAETDPFANEDEDLLFANIESVYSASKHDQKVTEAPARVNIITSEEIQSYGYKTLGDILNSLPGFSLNYDRNYSYIGVRGFGLPGDYNSRILFLIDGHRLNDNIYNSVGTDTSFILDIDLIDRVEIVSGPSSSLYGSNAFFGLINIITKRGRSLEGVEISTATGSQESHKGRLTFGKRFKSSLEIILSGTYYESDGDSSLYYAEFDDPTTNNGIFENGDNDQVESFFTRASYKDFTLEAAYNNREKRIPTAPWEVEFNDNQTQTIDQTWFVDLKYQHFYEKANLDATFRLFYDSYEYYGDYVYDYGPPPDIVTNKDKDKGNFWGTEIQLNRVFFDKHRVAGGIEYRDSVDQRMQNYDVYGDYLDSNSDTETFGLFAQDEWSIIDKLILNIGVRYDDYSTGEKATNPRVALIFSPFDTTSLKLLYGEAFRAPNSYELYYHDGYSSTKPALELNSETIDSYEAVWEQKITNNIRGSFSVYQNQINNLIAYTQDPSDTLFVFANIDEAEATGGEISFEGQWANGIKSAFNYSYQQAENHNTGARLVNSPRHMVKTNIIATIIPDILGAGLEVQYDGGRETIGGNETDSFLVTNLTLTSKNLIHGMTLSANVHNLFDKNIDYPASEEHTQDIIRQDGRTYWFKLDYLFLAP